MNPSRLPNPLVRLFAYVDTNKRTSKTLPLHVKVINIKASTADSASRHSPAADVNLLADFVRMLFEYFASSWSSVPVIRLVLQEISFGVTQHLLSLNSIFVGHARLSWRDCVSVKELEEAKSVLGQNHFLLSALDSSSQLDLKRFPEILASL